FRTPKPRELESGGGEGSKLGKNIKEEKQLAKIEFIPSKRSQNVQIALRMLKKTNEEIRKAIVEMDETVFMAETLEKFLETAPTEDEQRQTEKEANKDDINPLKQFGKCELFFYVLIDLPDLQMRLQLWHFKLSFKGNLFEKHQQLKSLEDACQVIRKSEALREILQIVLAWGNHMNGDTPAGQAYGFDLESLHLLTGVKTFDNSLNMMMFLYKFIYEKQPKLLKVFDELAVVHIACKIESEMIEKSVKKVKDDMDLLDATLTRFEGDYEDVLPVNDKFIPVMKEFQSKSNPEVKKLLQRAKDVKDACNKLGLYFAYDLENHRIEQLFTILSDFIRNLEKGRDDLHKLEKDRERKRQKKNGKKSKKKKEKATGEKIQEIKENGIQKREVKEERSILDDIKTRV
ncbi:hypothetical protein RFI_27985, partial [Reticulomyxa filosa]